MSDLFTAGVQALRRGDRTTAADLLRQAVAENPAHEQAWLWLSGAVATADERRHCLQQALALNPQNEAVRRSLQELEQAQPAPKKRRPSPPPPPAPTTPPPLEYAAYSEFDDVWSRIEHINLCPYCAAELAAEHRHCPACGKNLILSYYRYENPSSNLHVYWVFVLGLGQLALIQLIFDVLMGEPMVTLVQRGVFIPLSLGLTVFVMRRHFWAYIASLLMLFSAGALLLAAPVLDSALVTFFMGDVFARTPLVGLGEGVVSFINGAVRMLQLGCIGLGLFYGVFLTAPDFARDELRLTAVAADSQTAEAAFLAGDRYAKKGMWASAVLNWRRANVLMPTRLLYSLSLAQAYRQLRFYERSRDVLQSASKMATTHEGQTKIQEELLKLDLLDK